MISYSTIQGWLYFIAPDFLIRVKNRIMASPIGARLARGTLWSLIAGCVSKSFGLVASIIIARLLGKEPFGELGILQSTLEMFGSIAAFGMGLTSTKYVAECRHSDPDKAGRIIAMSSLVAWVTGGLGTLILIFSAPWLATRALAAPELASLLQISSISLLFGAVNGAQVGGLAGFEAFKQLAKINLVSGLLTVALRVVGTMALGLKGAVVGMVAAQVLGCFINFLVLRKLAHKSGICVKYAHCLVDLPVIWKFSLPTVLNSFLVMPAFWICNAMLVNRPGGYGEMAIYNAANQWFYIFLFIPGLLGEAALPVLFDRISHKDYINAHKIFTGSLKLNAVIISPLIIAGLFSNRIMALYGDSFGAGWLTLAIVLATAAMVSIQLPASYILIASGRMWLLLFLTLGWVVVFVNLAAWMIPWGSVGLALARLIAFGLHTVLTMALCLRILRKHLESQVELNEVGQRKMLTALEEQRALIKD